MTLRRAFFLTLIGAAAGLGTGRAPAQSRPVRPVLRLALASDMQFALQELAARFEAETGQALALQSGSSGNLARQIMQGMVVDLFVSADESYVFELADAGLTQGRGLRYATGRLALLAHKDSVLALDERLLGLRSQLGNLRRFAIANPQHAPYGRAARQALMHAGLWDALSAKLVLGENVAQATQFVASGAAQAGIVSLSMARVPQVASATRHALLAEDLHPPLHQRLVLLKGATASAQAFVDFMARPDSRELLRRHGLGDPL